MVPMVIDMNETELKTVAQLRAFLNGTLAVEFQPLGEGSPRYAHIAAVLRRLGYRRLKRQEKGVVLRYLERTTGYSRQQLTRLVRAGSLTEKHCACAMRRPGRVSGASSRPPTSRFWPRPTRCTPPCRGRPPAS